MNVVMRSFCDTCLLWSAFHTTVKSRCGMESLDKGLHLGSVESAVEHTDTFERTRSCTLFIFQD